VVIGAAGPIGNLSPLTGMKVDTINVGSTPAIDLNPEDLPHEEYSRAFKSDAACNVASLR
jgi:hypothetical protein